MRASLLSVVALGVLAGASTPSENLGSESQDSLLPRMRGWIPDHLMDFIGEMHKRSTVEQRDLRDAKRRRAEEQGEVFEEEALEARQAVAPGGGLAPGAATIPTQMPSVTVFQLSGKAIPYTQTFPPTPGQWAAPTNGVIGL